jgi:hypothetical protein
MFDHSPCDKDALAPDTVPDAAPPGAVMAPTSAITTGETTFGTRWAQSGEWRLLGYGSGDYPVRLTGAAPGGVPTTAMPRDVLERLTAALDQHPGRQSREGDSV